MEHEEYTIPQMIEDALNGKLSRRRCMKRLAALGITAAGIGAIMAAASSDKAMPASPASTLHPLQKQLHQQHLSYQTRGDIQSLHNDYADNAVVEDSMHASPFIGQAAIMKRKQNNAGAIPDLHITVTNRVSHGNQLAVEWVATGTHAGDLPGLPASGRKFSIHGVTVVERHEGKIVRESLYYDMKEVYRQLSRS